MQPNSTHSTHSRTAVDVSSVTLGPGESLLVERSEGKIVHSKSLGPWAGGNPNTTRSRGLNTARKAGPRQDEEPTSADIVAALALFEKQKGQIQTTNHAIFVYVPFPLSLLSLAFFFVIIVADFFSSGLCQRTTPERTKSRHSPSCAVEFAGGYHPRLRKPTDRS
jgi:hypothetical protein